MIHLEINIAKKELDVVLETLENSISDLKMEIADTDQMDFREGLKNKRIIIQKVIDALREQSVAIEN